MFGRPAQHLAREPVGGDEHGRSSGAPWTVLVGDGPAGDRLGEGAAEDRPRRGVVAGGMVDGAAVEVEPDRGLGIAGALDLGPWEQVFYAEFDGQRKKRVVVKVMGE